MSRRKKSEAWLIKTENEETDESFGKAPEQRTIEELIASCIIVVDKHPGPTSHQITRWTGDIFGAKNPGHTGTLDPAVTGVLPVALGDATKAMPVLMTSAKEYVGVMYLHNDVTEDALRKTIVDKFIGKIKQTPPVKSAVARKERVREIFFFDIIEIKERNVLFRVGCEAGTYIRKLCHDIGEELGVGAHMTGLRRTKAGEFTEEQSRSLIHIKDAYEMWKESGDDAALRKLLIPTEHTILHVKRVFIKDNAVDAVCNGAPLYAAGITRIQPDIMPGETIAVYTLKGELVAIGIAKMYSEDMLKAKKGSAVRTDRVFMQRGIYPSMKKNIKKND